MIWFEKPWFDVPYALLSTPSTMKLLRELLSPFTLNEASRLEMFDRRTPGDNNARSA